MRTAHFDCFSGISGDMTLAALIDAGVDPAAIIDGIGSLGLPVEVEIEKVRKGGFAATHVRIEAPTQHEHRFLREVEDILSRGKLTDKQRELAFKIFHRLAEAEAAVHGMPVEKVHFHEVGALDSIADIAGSAIGLDLLGVERFSSGPVAVGGGMVKCEHGHMPVPAPATAELLKGVPLRSSPVKAELTTPTGAAILTSIVGEWIEQPAITIERIGLGAGRREFVEQPNVLRLFVGTSAGVVRDGGYETDQVWLLETNIDDMPAEAIGYCCDRLMAAGAFDVFTTAIFMKKNRPGVTLSVLVAPELVSHIDAILFHETTTLGVRRQLLARHKLQRRACSVETPWGPVQGKLAWQDGKAAVFSPEHDDCALIAREHHIPLREVVSRAHQIYQQNAEHGG
ncbi:MAG: nickel pincer cofactor biosynthesis protein LarC [Planctomycetes bacterium]|nr:nickel pincer cofactor biosynthesis protein LarC [Planctomycetota bacterium]